MNIVPRILVGGLRQCQSYESMTMSTDQWALYLLKEKKDKINSFETNKEFLGLLEKGLSI